MRSWGGAAPTVSSPAAGESRPIDGGPLFLSAPHVALLAALVPLVWLVWRPGEPGGADTWGHLFRAEHLASRMREDGLGAYFTSAWTPGWYLGDPYRTYYPPLTVLLLGPLVFLCGGDVTLAWRLFMTAFILGFAHLAYVLSAREEEGGRAAAALTAALAVWAPYTLRTAFDEGNLPRVLAVLALPVIGWLSERILVRPTWTATLALGGAWCWAIVAHAQQAYVFAIALAVYAVVRLVTGSDVHVPGVARGLVAVVVGGALSAPWVLPAYSQAELPGVPFLPAEKAAMAHFAANLRSLWLAVGAPESAIVVGVGTVVLATAGTWTRPGSRRLAWFLSGLFCLFLSFRPGLIALVPASSQLLPERFLNYAAFAFAVAAAGVLPLAAAARWRAVAAGAALLVVLDAIPAAALAARHTDTVAPRAAARLIAAQPEDGRVIVFSYPEPQAVDTYFATRGGRDLAGGWAIENTPHHAAMRRVLAAPQWGQGYLERLLDLWNVRHALLRATDHPDTRFLHGAREALLAAGFEPRGVKGPYELLSWPRPAGLLRRLPEGRMLVVGEGAQPMLAAFPFAEEASTSRLERATSDELSEHAVLGVMRFAETEQGVEESERLLRTWLESGGRAIVSLSGMDTLLDRRRFLGVDVRALQYTDALPIRWQGRLSGLPEPLPVSGFDDVPAWRGVVYDGLDGHLATVEHEGRSFGVVGWKDVGKGRAWFLGLNVLYWAQRAGQPALASAIAELTLEGADLARGLHLEPVSVSAARVDDGRLTFRYDTPQAIDAVVSFTWTPRWRALVDARPVPLREHEHLMRVHLPAGRHELVLRYEPWGTAWPRAGMAIAGGVLALLLALVVRERWTGPEPVAEDARASA